MNTLVAHAADRITWAQAGNRIARSRPRALHLIGVAASAAALFACSSPDKAYVDPRLAPSYQPAPDQKKGRVLLLDSQHCPEGGESVAVSMVVQDYIRTQPAEDGNLIAIRPDVAFPNAEKPTAYCGSDYGPLNGHFYGDVFEGKALVVVGSSTLSDLD